MNYIMSSHAIHKFIAYKFDFLDEEVVDYYVSLLKSLSLKLDTSYLQLFFN